MPSDETRSNKIPLHLTEAALEAGIVELYREDETVAVVINIEKFDRFTERVRIDPKRWTSSVASLMKNIKHALTVKGIDKIRINEIGIETANVINQNYTVFKDIIKKNGDDSSNGSKNKNAKNQDEGNFEVTSDAQALADLASRSENIVFFKNQYGEPYTAIRIGNDRYMEIISLKQRNTKCRYWLTRLFRENRNGQIPGESTINNAINALAANAIFDGKTIPLHLRVAWGNAQNRSSSGCIYYDMSDSNRRIIEISDIGWRIINGSDNSVPILFKRHNQTAQVQPDRNYPPDIFDQFLNLTNVKNESHRHLLKVYIVSLFIPDIDHTILTTYGPQGAAKSFLLRLIKELVDPSKPALLTLLRNIPEFIQQINHNYLAFYDNVKYIPYWLSDEICKAITGIGHTKRELYSDDEDVIYEHRRCISLNGINVALTEPDALDRSIFIELLEIDDENRKKKEDLVAGFEKIKPKLLAYIFDIIVKAMVIKPTLRLLTLSRMADFTEWGEAISRAMNYEKMSFIRTYNQNRNEQNIVAVNENLVSSLLVKFWNDYKNRYSNDSKFIGSPDLLFTELVDFAQDNGIKITSRQFPASSNILVKKLNPLKSNIREGFGIVIDVERNKENNSIVTIYDNKKEKQNSFNPLLNHTYSIQILHKHILR